MSQTGMLKGSIVVKDGGVTVVKHGEAGRPVPTRPAIPVLYNGRVHISQADMAWHYDVSSAAISVALARGEWRGKQIRRPTVSELAAAFPGLMKSEEVSPRSDLDEVIAQSGVSWAIGRSIEDVLSGNLDRAIATLSQERDRRRAQTGGM